MFEKAFVFDGASQSDNTSLRSIVDFASEANGKQKETYYIKFSSDHKSRSIIDSKIKYSRKILQIRIL